MSVIAKGIKLNIYYNLRKSDISGWNFSKDGTTTTQLFGFNKITTDKNPDMKAYSFVFFRYTLQLGFLK